MKTPIDSVTGDIVRYDERSGTMTITAHYDDWQTMTRRGYRKCRITFLDDRKLSDQQRRMCYSLLREIGDYTGQGTDGAKEWLKIKFMIEDLEQTGEELFSLSNAPMSLVAAFQRYLIRFCLEWDIPTNRPMLEYVDDVQDYIFRCLASKKCCICGAHADLHHVERVGMGRNRDEIIHEGMEALPLCRMHHQEAHTMPDEDFFERYHIDGGIKLDKTLCRVYGLKTKKEEK